MFSIACKKILAFFFKFLRRKEEISSLVLSKGRIRRITQVAEEAGLENREVDGIFHAGVQISHPPP